MDWSQMLCLGGAREDLIVLLRLLQSTVAELKTELEQRVNAPSTRLRVIFKGRALLDEQTLSEAGEWFPCRASKIEIIRGALMGSDASPACPRMHAGIQDNDTVHLVVRPADAPPFSGEEHVPTSPRIMHACAHACTRPSTFPSPPRPPFPSADTPQQPAQAAGPQQDDPTAMFNALVNAVIGGLGAAPPTRAGPNNPPAGRQVS
jgi:hypothetical protein